MEYYFFDSLCTAEETSTVQSEEQSGATYTETDDERHAIDADDRMDAAELLQRRRQVTDAHTHLCTDLFVVV